MESSTWQNMWGSHLGSRRRITVAVWCGRQGFSTQTTDHRRGGRGCSWLDGPSTSHVWSMPKPRLDSQPLFREKDRCHSSLYSVSQTSQLMRPGPWLLHATEPGHQDILWWEAGAGGRVLGTLGWGDEVVKAKWWENGQCFWRGARCPLQWEAGATSEGSLNIVQRIKYGSFLEHAGVARVCIKTPASSSQ